MNDNFVNEQINFFKIEKKKWKNPNPSFSTSWWQIYHPRNWDTRKGTNFYITTIYTDYWNLYIQEYDDWQLWSDQPERELIFILQCDNTFDFKWIKGIVNIFLYEPPLIDWHVRFKIVPLKDLSDQVLYKYLHVCFWKLTCAFFDSETNEKLTELSSFLASSFYVLALSFLTLSPWNFMTFNEK